jgi:hypothetical protein
VTQKLQSKQPNQPETSENADNLKVPAEDEAPKEPEKSYNVDLTKGLDNLQPLDSTWEERNVLGDGHFFELKNQ